MHIRGGNAHKKSSLDPSDFFQVWGLNCAHSLQINSALHEIGMLSFLKGWVTNLPSLPGTEELLELGTSSFKTRRVPGTLGWVGPPNKMVHLQVPPSLGPKPHLLSFQGSQPGLEPGLSTAEISHHGLHLLPVFLAQHLHLPGPLGLLILHQQPGGVEVARGGVGGEAQLGLPRL